MWTRASCFRSILCTLRTLTLSVLVTNSFVAFADPVLGPLFADHMVLQRDRPIRINGTADPGETIAVNLDGRQVGTRADARGRWEAVLPAVPAGGPFTLTIEGKKTIAVHDVLFGEVWVASGQSNMTYSLTSSAGAGSELPQADLPEVRLFEVPLNSKLVPQSFVRGTWLRCTPINAKDFSPVGYYFARDLSRRLHVPVGIIESAWPGSRGEEWTSLQTLSSKPELRPFVEHWHQVPASVKSFAAEGTTFDLEFDSFELLPKEAEAHPVSFSNFDKRSADTLQGGFWETSGPGYLSLTNPGFAQTQYAARFAGAIDLEQSPSLRATLPGSRQGQPAGYDLSGYKGIQFRVRGRGCFSTHLEEPATSDGDYYKARPVCAQDDWQLVTQLFSNYGQAGWGVVSSLNLTETQAFAIDAEAGDQHDAENPPAGLYNGMILPITGYPIRGALWYQGEGNSGRAHRYRTLLPALIGDRRAAWHEGDFPFLIVQLPNFGKPTLNAEDADWAKLREVQAIVAKTVPASGLVVTIDLGEAGNLHPPRKAEVGRRLALLALANVYDIPIEFSGPVLRDIRREGAAMRLGFYHAAGLTAQSGGTVKGFALAGPDQKFFPASATIVGTDVFVSSPSVPYPLAVRYAWAANPICNLINGTGLPAGPFRSDDWPATTGKDK